MKTSQRSVKNLIDWLIDWIVFYAVSAVFKPYYGGFVFLCWRWCGYNPARLPSLAVMWFNPKLLPSPRHDEYNMAVSMYMPCSLNNNYLNTIFSVLDTNTAKKDFTRKENERHQLVPMNLLFNIECSLTPWRNNIKARFRMKEILD